MMCTLRFDWKNGYTYALRINEIIRYSACGVHYKYSANLMLRPIFLDIYLRTYVIRLRERKFPILYYE